jgi:hypothetical protein
MATGDHFQLGELNGAEDSTILRGEASEDGSQDFSGNAILVVERDNGPVRQIRHDCDGIKTSGRGAGAGISADSEAGDGVVGSADLPSSSGVRGASKHGTGVQGFSRNGNGVVGRSVFAGGVFGSSIFRIGVFGECTAPSGLGIGVEGRADVKNNPSVIGVLGASTEGIGVEGSSTSGVGIYGHSSNNRGGVFGIDATTERPIAQLRLQPRPIGRDLGLPRDGEAGDFFVTRQGGDSDLVDLWFCIAGPQGAQTALWGQVAFSQTRNA